MAFLQKKNAKPVCWLNFSVDNYILLTQMTLIVSRRENESLLTLPKLLGSVMNLNEMDQPTGELAAN